MTDTTSLVPKYTFPDTLDEQEAALAANPLLQRLNEAPPRLRGRPPPAALLTTSTPRRC